MRVPHLPILRHPRDIRIPIRYQDNCARVFTQGAPELAFSTWDFLWSHLTVGHPIGQLQVHSQGRLNYLIARTILMCGMVDVNQSSDGLRWHSAYKDLDPSEKTAFSYSHGMAITKLVMATFYDAPWACHLSLAGSLSPSVTAVLNSGQKTQPDLVGPNRAGQWVVGEAKARRALRSGSHSHIRAQLGGVSGLTVNGRHASVGPRVGSILRTHPTADFGLEIIDPPGVTDEPIDPQWWRAKVFERLAQQLSMRRLETPRDPSTLLKNRGHAWYILPMGEGPEADAEIGTLKERLGSGFSFITMPDGSLFVLKRSAVG
jgi:hypothetical protein